MGRAAAGDRAQVVQVLVSQLRKQLAGDGAEIVTRGRGYELRWIPTPWTRCASSAS